MDITLTEATEKPATKPLLEVWGRNEVMRHVPSLEWFVRKLDHDLRHRIETLYPPVAALPHDDARRAAIDEIARALCRAIDRLAETAKHSRLTQPPNDLGERLTWSLNHAIASLNSLDPSLFGRRCPFHTFERSRTEPVYSGMAAVLWHVRTLTAIVRTIDPDLDARLLDGLVTLEVPLRREPMA
jgi:hypothetical protein